MQHETIRSFGPRLRTANGRVESGRQVIYIRTPSYLAASRLLLSDRLAVTYQASFISSFLFALVLLSRWFELSELLLGNSTIQGPRNLATLPTQSLFLAGALLCRNCPLDRVPSSNFRQPLWQLREHSTATWSFVRPLPSSARSISNNIRLPRPLGSCKIS